MITEATTVGSSIMDKLCKLLRSLGARLSKFVCGEGIIEVFGERVKLLTKVPKVAMVNFRHL